MLLWKMSNLNMQMKPGLPQPKSGCQQALSTPKKGEKFKWSIYLDGGNFFLFRKKAASPSLIHPISFFLHDLQLLMLFLFCSCHIVNAQQKQNKHYVMKALYY